MEKYNLVKVFENSILEHWNLPALSDYNGSTLTYAIVGEKIIKIHSCFEHCGLKPGDKVALIGKNSVNWAIAYLATVTYGATIVPILSDFHSDNIHHIVNHSDAQILYVSDSIWPSLKPGLLDKVKAVFNLTDYSIFYEKNESDIHHKTHLAEEEFFDKFPNGVKKEDFILPNIPNSNLGVISYTSGTTGNSKGVMLPLQSLMDNVEFAWNNMPLQAEDKLLSILPLAHAYGCAFEFIWPFTIGVHIIFLGKVVSPQIMIQAFQEIKPNLLLMVPLIMEKIYKKQLQPVLSKTSMRILLYIPLINTLIYKKIKTKLSAVFGGEFHEVVIGGAALNKEVEIFLRRIGFNFSVGYGMTECGPLISYANWDKAKLGSCGKLVDSLELMIDSPDQQNIPGEILVRGTNVMLGYYKNEKETKKVLDEEGWLHTGDLGVIDNSGFISIKGRSKSMILGPSGENIYPEEIESKLNNFPFVQEQLVINENNKLIALVFPDKVKIEQEQINEEQLVQIMEENKKLLNAQLPKYMQISKIKLQEEEFEKTPKLSIKRFKYEKN